MILTDAHSNTYTGIGTMKRNTLCKIMPILLIIILAAVNAAAEDRIKPFEMADGHYVWFKMTLNEMLAEDAQKARRLALSSAKVKEPEKWVLAIELPESGQVVVFPMSPEEIRMAQRRHKDETAAIKATRSAEANQDDGMEATVIEMVDGNTVSFTSYKEQPPASHDSWLSRLIRRIYS